MYPRKKSLALISALLASLTLAACGGGGSDSSGPGGDSSTIPIVTTTPADTSPAKVRFFNAASCYGDQSASMGSTVLTSAQGYNKPATAVQNIPLTAGSVMVNAATGTLATLNVNLVAKNSYTLVSTNNATAAKVLVAQSAPFDPAGRLFRMRVINASASAVDVYVLPAGDQNLPATPTFSVSNELSVSEPLIQAVTANELRLVVTLKGDISAPSVLFDSATNDLKVAVGDDLSIVVPPFGLCAGADTNRVRVLNAKAGEIDQSIIDSEVLVGTISVRSDSIFGAKSRPVTFEDSALNILATLSPGKNQTVNIRGPLANTLKMKCGSGLSSITKYFSAPVKGNKYDLSALCTTSGFSTLASVSLSFTETDLGEYGN
jgi:hypothetical protein